MIIMRQAEARVLKCQLQLLCYHIQTRRHWEASLTRLSSYDPEEPGTQMRRNLVNVITAVPGGARVLDQYRQLRSSLQPGLRAHLKIGRETGWQARYIGDWGHPRGQEMLEFTQPEGGA